MREVTIKINGANMKHVDEVIDYDHYFFNMIHELAGDEFNRVYAGEHDIYGVIASPFKVVEKFEGAFVLECSLDIQHWDTPNSSWNESERGLITVVLG
jgi:hypothetical protein